MVQNNSFIYTSIIIPSYNSQMTIRACLQSVLNQDYPSEKYEVIVVDDGSEDISDFFLSQAQVRLIKQKHAGPGAARNNGFRHARGEILLFLDSDCIVASDWVRRHVNAHINAENKSKGIAYIGGSIKLPPRENNFFRICDYYSSWYSPPQLPKGLGYEYLPSTNISIRRDIFAEIGGFNEYLWCGEDVDFGIKIRKSGYRIRFDPKIHIYHIGRGTLKSYLKHHYDWGVYAPYFRQFGSEAKYNYLFPPQIIIAIFIAPLLVVSYTAYVILKWLFLGHFFVLLIAPLIFISKIAYICGNLKGTARTF